MTKDEIFNELKAVLISDFGLKEEDIAWDALLMDDLDLDSIDSIDILVRLKRIIPEAKDNISPALFSGVETISDLVDVLYNYIK